MFLVKMNFIAFMTALNSLADGSEKMASSIPYDTLPHNSSGRVYTFVFRNASIIDPQDSGQIVISNIAANSWRQRASFVPQVAITAVGSVNGMSGVEEYDASNFYVMQKFGRLRPSESAELLFFKKDRVIDWKSPTFEKDYPPDAVFSLGKFVKGAELFPTK
jgi:hypothetical protein